MANILGVVSRPWLYVAWGIAVILLLSATYFANPYIFGFATFAAFWVSCVVVLMGLASVLISRSLAMSQRVLIVAALLITALAILLAMEVLGSFHWA